MENSDDYFDDDDLVLDDATEAAIAESERQYASQTAPAVLRVAKKQRTATGWTPGLGGRADSLGDLDLPEITVQDNGYYASARNQPSPTPSLNSARPLDRRQPIPPRNGSYIPPRLNWQGNTPQRHIQGNTPAPIPQRLLNTSHFPVRLPNVSRSASSSTIYASKPSTSPHPLEDQMHQLRQQLEELRRSNTEMQSALQGALDSKTAKEGEVTILRKIIEKNSQTHAAEMARIKVVKQEAESKQIQAQKILKEEMERLKSQLAFKHQEVLEATFKKPPPSVRSKKTFRDTPGTPLPSSSGGGWNIISQRPNFTVDVQRTPSRPAYIPPVSPRKAPQKSPTKSKKAVMLPGFQNSFTSSTPLRSSQSKSKGKEKDIFLPDDGHMFDQILPSQPFPSFWNPTKQENPEQIVSEPSPKHSPPMPVDNMFNSQPDNITGNANFIITPLQTVNEDEEPVEDIDLIDPPDWKADLCRMILTHVRVNSDQQTFRHLLAVSFAGPDGLVDSRHYSSCCMRIMDAISHPTGMEGYDECLKDVANSFVAIIEILTRKKLVSQLVNLFNLLEALVFYLPKLRSFILGQDDPAASPLICILCGLILTELAPSPNGENELGRELLAFLEAICFELSEEDALKFSDFVRNREVVMTLLNPAQPTPFLIQVARTLVQLSIRKQLHRFLLSLPDPDQAGDISVKNGLTERLCSFLIDSTRIGVESYRFRETILTYFAQLSLAHPDAYATLSSLPIFLASVLWYISQLTAPLWEDDEQLMESASNSLELIQCIGRAIYFMHHLIFSTEPVLNLRYKLQQAPPRPFVNILEVFIVSFGRLSYAEAPDWLDENCRNGLEQLIEMARDILELVVDGPEGDDIWHAYQDDLEEEKFLDEEEMEAEMVD